MNIHPAFGWLPMLMAMTSQLSGQEPSDSAVGPNHTIQSAAKSTIFVESRSYDIRNEVLTVDGLDAVIVRSRIHRTGTHTGGISRAIAFVGEDLEPVALVTADDTGALLADVDASRGSEAAAQRVSTILRATGMTADESIVVDSAAIRALENNPFVQATEGRIDVPKFRGTLRDALIFFLWDGRLLQQVEVRWSRSAAQPSVELSQANGP